MGMQSHIRVYAYVARLTVQHEVLNSSDITIFFFCMKGLWGLAGGRWQVADGRWVAVGSWQFAVGSCSWQLAVGIWPLNDAA